MSTSTKNEQPTLEQAREAVRPWVDYFFNKGQDEILFGHENLLMLLTDAYLDGAAGLGPDHAARQIAALPEDDHPVGR